MGKRTSTCPDIYGRADVEFEDMPSGTIDVLPGFFIILSPTAANFALLPPVSASDDGKKLEIISRTPYAHTITSSPGAFNTKYQILTMNGHVGNSVILTALDGFWFAPTFAKDTDGGGVTLSNPKKPEEQHPDHQANAKASGKHK
jgi:hypothetical protein